MYLQVSSDIIMQERVHHLPKQLWWGQLLKGCHKVIHSPHLQHGCHLLNSCLVGSPFLSAGIEVEAAAADFEGVAQCLRVLPRQGEHDAMKGSAFWLVQQRHHLVSPAKEHPHRNLLCLGANVKGYTVWVQVACTRVCVCVCSLVCMFLHAVVSGMASIDDVLAHRKLRKYRNWLLTNYTTYNVCSVYYTTVYRHISICLPRQNTHSQYKK